MPASAGVDGVRQPGSMIPEPTTATVAPDADKEVQIDNASAQERKQPVQGHEDAIEFTEGDTVLDGLDGAGPTKSQAREVRHRMPSRFRSMANPRTRHRLQHPSNTTGAMTGQSLPSKATKSFQTPSKSSTCRTRARRRPGT